MENTALIVDTAWERMRLACEAVSHASRVRSQVFGEEQWKRLNHYWLSTLSYAS